MYLNIFKYVLIPFKRISEYLKVIYTIAFIWLAVRWKNVAKDYTKRATGLKRKGSKIAKSSKIFIFIF